MTSRITTLIAINIVIFTVGLGGLFLKNHTVQETPFLAPPPIEFKSVPVAPNLPLIRSQITIVRPGHLSYDQTIKTMKKWSEEAPELAEVGSYGSTKRGQICQYIRISNRRITSEKPRVLITACIHGNEPLSASVTMWYASDLLSNYGKDDEITKLVDEREIYFVPVVSPDSYPSQRMVDGVDPNRDFPNWNNKSHHSVAPVQAIQDLFEQVRPKAVMSGHTWGRVYLTPFGDSLTRCPDHEAIISFVGKMCSLSGYRQMRACEMYNANGSTNNPPIRVSEGESVLQAIKGTEIDWYYRRGAFAIVTEYGTHQRIPSESDTRTEFDKTFGAFKLFVWKAPLVKLSTIK
jgi:hypothetical protein